jgi:hypothetical protein
MQEKKKKLIAALKTEIQTTPEFNIFGESNNLHHHKEAIEYLETGEFADIKDNKILFNCIHDIESVFETYEIF